MNDLFETKEQHKEILRYAENFFASELAELYYPDLYVLPLTADGEIERVRLYSEDEIGMYGTTEKNFKFNGETYCAILVNND